MKFYVTKDVFEKIPDGKFGLVSVTGADNTGSNPEIQAFLQENVEKCTEFYTGKKVKNEPELQPYREAFRNMGINPNRYMCAIEALMTRIAKGQGMPAVNTIVDLGNGVSLKHHLPFGAEEREPVEAGEVVYATGSHVRTRRWTWRQGNEGMITENTSHMLYIIDGFECNLEEVLAAREELAELAEKYLGGTVKIGMIDKENMEFETEL